MGGGIVLRGGIAGISGGGLPLTYMYVLPIEAPCYAVRLGFGNCFNAPMTILSASVWPSDGYGRCVAMQEANGETDTTDFAPTGGAPFSKIFFDNGGADVAAINPVGSQRSFGMPTTSANLRNAAEAFTIQWSDFAPCTSISPVDGSLRHLLFVYVTVASGSIASDISRFRTANLDPIALRGRHIYRGAA
jgi:hypothetical protein